MTTISALKQKKPRPNLSAVQRGPLQNMKSRNFAMKEHKTDEEAGRKIGDHLKTRTPNQRKESKASSSSRFGIKSPITFTSADRLREANKSRASNDLTNRRNTDC